MPRATPRMTAGSEPQPAVPPLAHPPLLCNWACSIPTVIVFKNGEKMETVIGAVPKSTLVQTIEKVCACLGAGGGAICARSGGARLLLLSPTPAGAPPGAHTRACKHPPARRCSSCERRVRARRGAFRLVMWFALVTTRGGRGGVAVWAAAAWQAGILREHIALQRVSYGYV